MLSTVRIFDRNLRNSVCKSRTIHFILSRNSCCHQLEFKSTFNNYSTYAPFTLNKKFCTNSTETNSPVNIQKTQTNQSLDVTKLGAAVNFGLSISKGITGVLVGSTALIADAVNSLGDLVTDGIVYFSIIWSRRKANTDHPWGNGKIEPLGGIL